MGRAWINETVSWPDHGRDVEAWADRLEEYPDTGWLQRGIDAHEHERLALGWRFVAGEWVEPPKRRRSVGQAGAMVRKAVMRLVWTGKARGTIGEIISDAVIGLLEGCADLFFYETTDKAWAKATVDLAEVSGRYRRNQDPLRARFRDVGQVLCTATENSTKCLGAGPQSYAVAESKGRMRARWNEIRCAGSHVSSGAVKSLGAVEFSADARRSALQAGLDEVDLAGLVDWLRDGVKREERVRRYRRRLAVSRGVLVEWVCEDDGSSHVTLGGLHTLSDEEAMEATKDLTDRAIVERLTRARAQLERRLAKLPERAEALAKATGDKTFLAPLAYKREEKKRERRPRGAGGRMPESATEALRG